LTNQKEQQKHLSPQFTEEAVKSMEEISPKGALNACVMWKNPLEIRHGRIMSRDDITQ